jgi:3-oxoacyl-[acyl-carrier protein] reductase
MTSRRTALVTGASRGLGAGICAALARDGVAVAINFRSDGGAAEAVRDRIAAAGGAAGLFRADVTDEAEVDGLCRRVEESLGGIDILVLNATGPQPEILLEELTWADVLTQLDFFVKSPLLLTRRVLPGMKERGFGRVIHIGSDVVHLAPAESSAYVAAKSAQLGLVRSWARALGPHGITVNFVAPGWIPTDRHAGIPESVQEAYARNVPMRRLGTPGDVGETVAFLASDRAAFITGQTVPVNGGTTFT